MKLSKLFCLSILAIIVAFILNILYVEFFVDSSQDFLRFYEKPNFKGYPIESHYVTTEDGYILHNFRIQKKNTKITNSKKPILLFHGLSASADVWMMHDDEQQSIPYILANQGFDVWLINSRGNFFSTNHSRINPNVNMEFWDFTFQHQARYDLTAMLEYIYNVTNQTSHYIGHSQGGTILIAALADQYPQVIKNIDKIVLLGPSIYQSSKKLLYLAKAMLPMTNNEYSISTSFNHAYYSAKYMFTLTKWMFNLVMEDAESPVVYEKLPAFMAIYPSGASKISYIHWMQLHYNQIFQKFDYGQEKNLKLYNQINPPKYLLNNIRNEIYFITGTYDLAASKEDTERLRSELVNAKILWDTIDIGHVAFLLNNNMSYFNDKVVPYFLGNKQGNKV